MENSVEITHEILIAVVSFCAGFGARTVFEILRVKIKGSRGGE